MAGEWCALVVLREKLKLIKEILNWDLKWNKRDLLKNTTLKNKNKIRKHPRNFNLQLATWDSDKISLGIIFHPYILRKFLNVWNMKINWMLKFCNFPICSVCSRFDWLTHVDQAEMVTWRYWLKHSWCKINPILQKMLCEIRFEIHDFSECLIKFEIPSSRIANFQVCLFINH